MGFCFSSWIVPLCRLLPLLWHVIFVLFFLAPPCLTVFSLGVSLCSIAVTSDSFGHFGAFLGSCHGWQQHSDFRDSSESVGGFFRLRFKDCWDHQGSCFSWHGWWRWGRLVSSDHQFCSHLPPPVSNYIWIPKTTSREHKRALRLHYFWLGGRNYTLWYKSGSGDICPSANIVYYSLLSCRGILCMAL